MAKNNLFLFGMDGTLTNHGQPFNWTLETALKELMNFGEIGIITSEDYSGIKSKMQKFLEYSSVRYSLHILPCNGTQWWSPPAYHDREPTRRYGISMENYIGFDNFQKLMKLIVDYQSIATDDQNIRLKGSFISNRSSLINWCPIGNYSSIEDRLVFEQYDNKINFREDLISTFRKSIALSDFGKPITIKRSGKDGFDIFPKGWDKSFALNHFPNKRVWFVGNDCTGDGNDKEIYEACTDRSYETTGPEATVDIVYDIIGRITKEK